MEPHAIQAKSQYDLMLIFIITLLLFLINFHNIFKAPVYESIHLKKSWFCVINIRYGVLLS